MTDVAQFPTGRDPLEARLRAHAADRPAATAVIADGERISWQDLDERVTRAARGLRAAGLRDGDRVALQLPTGPEFVACYLGAWRAGLVSVPVNPGYTEPELAHVLSDSAASLLVTEAGRAGAVPSGVRAVTPADLLDGTDGTDGTDGRAGSGQAGRGRSGEDVVTLIYTSGTSGRPKGAMLSARALTANIAQVAALDLVRPDDIGLVPLPLFHVFGLNAALGVLLDAGATTVLLDRFDPAAGLRLIADTGVTTVAAAPSQFAAWAAQPGFAAAFAGVRWAMSGSAPLPPELVAGYAGAGVPLYQGYGLTEAAPVLTTNVASGKPGSIGRPLPGVDLKLCDHHGEVTEEDDPGEILVRGDNLFSGYWPDGRDGPDEDGWFATGDIAVTDADGDLRIVGRVHDMVLVNGFNVYPAEVEAALTRIPGVAEAAVTGEPDPVTGEAVVAYVLPDAAGGLTEQDVRAGLSGSLARFKQPRRIEIVRQFPHTVTGKVQKWRLTGDRVGNGAA